MKKETKTTEKNQRNQKFFGKKKINKIDKLLARLTNRWHRILKSGMKEGTLITNPTKIKRIIREYYDQLYINKLDNLDKTNKFLKTHKLPRLRKKKKI